MGKKMLILSILTFLAIIGILIFQITILENPFLVGFGFLLSTLSIILAIGIALGYSS